MMKKLKETFIKMRHYLHMRKMISLVSLYKIPEKRYLPGVAETKIGKIQYVDGLSFLAGLKEIFIDEIYKVKSYKDERPLIIDCGANIGLSALYFALKQNAKVYAFEADPDICATMETNLLSNGFSDEVTVANKAVWINDYGVKFDVEGGYSGQVHQHGHDLVKESIHIPSIRLRDFIDGFENVDFLKLDIEGAENLVITDCSDVLCKLDYIFIEYHSNASDPQMLGEILTTLKQAGFRFHVKEAFVSKNPFVHIENMCGMDMQLNIYAYR
jgi:FkbM family methyltransferase